VTVTSVTCTSSFEKSWQETAPEALCNLALTISVSASFRSYLSLSLTTLVNTGRELCQQFTLFLKGNFSSDLLSQDSITHWEQQSWPADLIFRSNDLYNTTQKQPSLLTKSLIPCSHCESCCPWYTITMWDLLPSCQLGQPPEAGLEKVPCRTPVDNISHIFKIHPHAQPLFFFLLYDWNSVKCFSFFLGQLIE